MRAQVCSNHVHNTDLSTAEWTGSPVFHTLWSYVPGFILKGYTYHAKFEMRAGP